LIHHQTWWYEALTAKTKFVSVKWI